MRLAACVLTSALLSVACGGCEDEQQNNGSAWEFEADAGGNNAPLDVAVAPDTRTPPVVGPVECLPVDPMVVIDEGPVIGRPTRPIAIGQGSWWFVRSNPQGRHALWRRGAFADEAVYVRDIDSLIDAGPGGVLFVDDGTIFLHDPGTGEDRELATVENDRDWSRAPYDSAAYRMVDRDIVTWVSEGVWIANADGSARLADLNGGLPYARNGAVAFGNDEDRLEVRTAGRAYELLEAGARNIALSNSNLWFRRQGSTIFQVPLDGLAAPAARPIEPLGATDCEGLAVSEDGTEVAAACRSREGQMALYRSREDASWEHVADVLEEPLQQTFNIGYGWVAHAVWSANPPHLVAVPPDGGPPVELGEVQKACLSCGAYWAPNYIEIEDGLVAWNYARNPGEEFDVEHVGMARLCIIPR